MTPIRISATAFENWQRGLLEGLFVEADLVEKHKKMANTPFPFLRATYWRWSETVFNVLPHLQSWQNVLAIGDTHIENFGTWRDVEGRLVWGANDFDDAFVMPWPLDLVRLAVSACFGFPETAALPDVCAAILGGYRAGLDAPAPVILERDTEWLRTALLLPEEERADFWDKFDKPSSNIPPAYAAALNAALPPHVAAPICYPRSAGLGSLGKPRCVAYLKNWRGGPVLREAKALLPSAWALARGTLDGKLWVEDIANSAFRAPDPHYRVQGNILVRRLSPNTHKIEVKTAGTLLIDPRMLDLMGREIAACHAGDLARADAVRAEVAQKGDAWLQQAASAMADAITAEQKQFAATA